MKIQYNYIGRDVSKSLENLCDKKLSRLAKFFKGERLVMVTFKAEAKAHAMQINITSGGKQFVANAKSEDMYKALDMCVDKLKLQLKKVKLDYRSDSAKKRDVLKFKNRADIEATQEINQ